MESKVKLHRVKRLAISRIHYAPAQQVRGVPCWVMGMIDRPDENDLVALFRPTESQPILPSFRTRGLTMVFLEKPFFRLVGEPPDFYPDRSRSATMRNDIQIIRQLTHVASRNGSSLKSLEPVPRLWPGLLELIDKTAFIALELYAARAIVFIGNEKSMQIRRCG